MSNTIEKSIKAQFAKFFEVSDWTNFKSAADYYLEMAAKLLTKDIKYEKNLKKLRRNVQKRLYIGIACELLLKAFFLKYGYWINKKKRKPTNNFPFKICKLNEEEFKHDDTITFKALMDGIHNIEDFGDNKKVVEIGLMIAKVFRDKEAHVVVIDHKYDPKNYRDIEEALVIISSFAPFIKGLRLTIIFSFYF